MTKPSDNPGTPPPNSSSSTTPQPKKKRVKMFARKKVAGKELSKKLNAQLKASQAQEPKNSDDSFNSTTRGEETGFTLVRSVVDVETPESRKIGGKNKEEKEKDSEGVRSEERGMGKRVVDSSPTSNKGKMAICRAEPDKVEEIVKKTGESGSGEAIEGLVNLGQKVDEPGSSVKETLTNLLTKVGDSYNPKKKRKSMVKTPGTARDNNKMKVTPFDSIEIPPTRGRATRCQLKKNKEVMQKASEEGKKKRLDKGMKKVGEPVEAVDVDEMDLVHQDEDVNTEVGFQTPNPKKAKTSSKKSTPMPKFVDPSTRVKKTRSIVKPKQVKIAEEEEWSGEEEDELDIEKDKMAKFGKRTILKSRIPKDLEEEGMVLLLKKLEVQSWKDIVFQMDGRLARDEIV
uniref:Uncharacterized protein n=1 Tax=Nicotiana tabacum TaxID=4097 RepID=A0A1S3ZMB7_TOBAC|nr:PREDICTED: uncharacterized protein LOC107788522 [Nicotiana tabacum]